MSECKGCGEPDPIYYPPESADEDGYVECPDCGWGTLVPNVEIESHEA